MHRVSIYFIHKLIIKTFVFQLLPFYNRSFRMIKIFFIFLLHIHWITRNGGNGQSGFSLGIIHINLRHGLGFKL